MLKKQPTAVSPGETASNRSERRLTPWTIFWLFVTAVSYAATIYLSNHSSVVGPQGIAGPQGVAGPQGEAGPPGPRGQDGRIDDRLQQIISALAKQAWLADQKNQFESLLSRWETQQKTTLDRVKRSVNREAIENIDKSSSQVMYDLSDFLQGIANNVGYSMDLNKHPNFDNNHNIAFPGDDEISDPYVKEEYRRRSDQMATSMISLNGLRDAIQRAIIQNDAIVFSFVQKTH